jgi:DNA transformation protein
MAAGLDPDRVEELFSAFGAVSMRRMFGGAGLYSDDIMFALVADGVIYFKTAPDGTSVFAHEHCGPFTYATKDGTRQLTSYWQMPDRLYDDPEELAQWARTALAAARAGQKRGRVKRRAGASTLSSRGRSR